MKKLTKNRIDMYTAVLSVMQTNQPIWQNTAMIVHRVNQLEEGLNLLHQKAATQSSITLGVSAMRKEKYASLSKTMISVQDALWIYGNATNNYALTARNRMAPSTIEDLSISARLIRMDVMQADLEQYGEFLSEFGVGSETINLLNTQIAEYRSIASDPRNAILERKTISYEIDQISRELNQLLRNDLDRMIRMYSSSFPIFVVAYFNARIVVNLHSKSHKSTEYPEEDIGS